MTSPAHVREEIAGNLEVLLLLMFMVAGIYFMKQLLLFVFTRLLLGIRSKMLLSLAFCLAAAFLSAFLDALICVVAVVISVAVPGSTASITASPRRARTIATCSMTAISSSTTAMCWSSSAAFCAA